MSIDDTIRRFYESSNEADRLTRGLGQLEAARTRGLISRFAAPAPATVIDVGGAAGAYALWLASQSYVVHLVDPIEALVAIAAQRSALQAQSLASCAVGHAQDLAFENESADIVLLLGPLYHLTLASDRAQALAEVMRVLKPGGVLFTASITRWAALLYGLSHDRFTNAAFTELVWAGVHDGQNRNPGEASGGFTTAYYHRPDELQAELVSAGFSVAGIFGVEGPASLLTDFEGRWADLRQREIILQCAILLEAEPSVIGTSAHLLAVARRPV